MIGKDTQASWEEWIAITRSRCHLHFVVEGGTLATHIAAGMETGRSCAARVESEISIQPCSILEIGSSVGFNCFGLALHYPAARVVGIEPDAEAVELARQMARDFGINNVEFVTGVAEALPFPDASFDLIVCHTVIEHVQNVDKSLTEMARVLSEGGQLHLEAPNYIWPEEPHVQIIMPPLCPKPLMRLLGKLQGKSADIDYVGHLQLVHPGWIERNFRQIGLTWINLVEQKLRRASEGDSSQIVAYRRAANLLSLFRKMRLDGLFIRLILACSMYPSLIYTATKTKAAKR